MSRVGTLFLSPFYRHKYELRGLEAFAVPRGGGDVLEVTPLNAMHFSWHLHSVILFYIYV